MIEYLQGRVRSAGENSLVIEVGGAGLRALCSLTTINELAQNSEAIVLYTRLLLRENNPPELFGFFNEQERAVFDHLCEVKGVSGRIALNILSKFSSASVVQAIQDQDDARLQVANGVGRRLAERIVVELRERVQRSFADIGDPGTEHDAPNTSLANDAIAGLVALGYKNAQARATVVEYMRKHPSSKSAADIIQNVLKSR